MGNQDNLLRLAGLYKTTSLTAKDKTEFEKYKKEIFEILITDKNADIRRLVAEDINTPIEILEILSTDDAKKVVRAVAKNTSTSMNILANLLKYYDESVVEEAKKNIENKKKEANKDLLKLADLYKTTSLTAKDKIEFEKYKKEIFEILITDKNADIRRLVAEDINTPIEILEILSTDDAKKVVRAVAKNTSTSMNILEKLLKYYDESVVEEAKKNIENKKKEALNPPKKIIENPEEKIISKLTELYKTASLGKNESADFEKYKNKIFEILITDKDVNTRKLVADDVNAPIEFLLILSKDKKERVRRGIAKNKSTTIEVLTELTNDGEKSVADEAVKNLRERKIKSGILLKTLEGHEGSVSSIAITPDGKNIVSGSNKTIKILDFAGNCLKTLEGHENWISSLAITPNGKNIISGSGDKTIKIWDFQGNCLKTLEGHKYSINSLAITPDGKNIISGSDDRTIKIWDLNGVCLKTLEGHTHVVYSLAITPNGKNIISGSDDRTIKIWDLNGVCLKTLEGHTHVVYSLAITSDNKNIVSGSGDNTIKIWDFNGNCLKTLEGHTESVKSLAITPNGKNIISGSGDKTIKIWDFNGNCLKTLKGHEDWVFSLAMTPDGKNIISGSDESTIKIWDIQNINSNEEALFDDEIPTLLNLYKNDSLNGVNLIKFENNKYKLFKIFANDKDANIRKKVAEDNNTPNKILEFIITNEINKEIVLNAIITNNYCLKTLEGHKNTFRSLAITPNGKNIISGSEDKTIKIWDLNGVCLKTLEGHEDWVVSLAMTPDGKNIISGGGDGTIKIWDFAGNCLKTLEGYKYGVSSLAITPNGKNIISGSYKEIKIWDFAGNCLKTLEGHTNSITSLTITPDGKNIISTSMDKTIKIWDFAGNCLKTLEGHEGWVVSLAMTSDGKNIISGSKDKTIKIWDFNKNCLKTLEGHTDSISSLGITPNGKNIISGSWDETIKIWDFAGNCLKTLEGHEGWVVSLGITPNGKNIISGGGDNTIKIWDLETLKKDLGIWEEDIEDEEFEDIPDVEFEDDLEDLEDEEDETITFINSEYQIISKLAELYKTASLSKNESADFEKYKNKIFEILITDKDVNTRKLVADDVNAPIDFLTKLSKDKEERVRRGIAKNKSTTIEILTELTNDGEKSVVDEAVKNLKSKKTKTEIKPNEKTEEPKKEEIKKEETTVKTPIPEPKKELKIDYNLFLEGILLYKSKDYLNSINVLKSFDNAYSYIYLADSYKNNNDLVNCKKYFKIAVEKGLLKIKDKYLSEPYYIYAKYLFEIENNYEASLESIITAFENEPNNIDYIKLSVEIYKALNNEKEIIQMLKKVYFLSKEHEDFKELFSQYDIADLYLKDVRHNKDFKIELSKQAINDLILIMLHLKLICITNKKVISIIKDINCSFEENNYIEEQFGDNPVYLEKYLQNHKIYEKVTLNLLKTLLYHMYLNESIIDSYLLDYKNYPIIKPSILNYLIEILKQLEITNKDFYPLKRNLLYNISKNKENYFNYKVIKQNINAQNYKEIYKYFPKTIDNNEIPDNV